MNMSSISQLKIDLEQLADPIRKEKLQQYFKTEKGGYGEGDIFLGLTVGEQRKISKKYRNIELSDVETLLQSKIHEHRLVALLILVEKFRNANESLKEKIVELYLRNTNWINNWDLVDVSAPKILGVYLQNKPRNILYDLAESEDLWEKRISILSTFTFIRNNDFDDTLKISKILLHDKHDLIHKAVGWMLREVGKKDQEIEESFLKNHYKVMPRTMLRYAIEKFDKEKRNFYLKK
jgi:3-methyladenine DNA glycosylase AlkD